jgi:tripartite-type tricarboxylate transporter receptor subunit TctC
VEVAAFAGCDPWPGRSALAALEDVAQCDVSTRGVDRNMKFSRRKFLQATPGAVALAAMMRSAGAQNWPNHVIRILVGFPPGGGADSACRIVASRLSEIWGQSVIVENRPGAGGNIALDAAAHAPADGYTLLLVTVAPPIYGELLGTLTYDPLADLVPVSMVGKYPVILSVSKTSPMKSVADFIANAKANPGKVTYASPGVGTTGHLSAELFKRAADIDITHVPYRGVAAGAMTDLITGRVDCMFNTTGSLLQAVRSGQIRGLGVSSAQRFELSPELPAIAETVPGFSAMWWYGLFVPGKTPDAIIRKMHADAVTMLDDAAVKTKFEPLGLAVASSTPEELAARERADAELWGPVIKAANIRAE